MITVIYLNWQMNNNKKAPSFGKKCKEVFLKMDLFSNGEFLKYKGEGAYQTYTGSILSVLIVVFFFAIFFNYCQQTFKREKITNTPKLRPSLNSPFNTNESSSVFMFAVGLEGIDLTSEDRLFDIVMSSKIYKNSKPFSSVDVPLEPCLAQQWEDINDQFKNSFSRLNFQQWLCPPKNYNFTFKGKYTSQEFRYTKLIVRRCSTGNCVSNSTFNTILMNQKTFKLSIYFANPVIDASEKQYLDYVLEDTNYFEFTDMVGVSSHIFLSQYQVNTDNSIYPQPFNDVVTQKGLTLNEKPVVSNFQIINTDQFVRINLRKSDLIQQFDRSYTRFDTTLAYLGGLFGMALILFYGMKAFSEYAYEFQIGSHLFVYNGDKRKPFENDKFHILRFPIYLLYCIVIFFYPSANEWSWFGFYREVDECREEVKQQTDVCFLIKRIIYIEKAIELFFGNKLNRIKLHSKWSLDEASQKRDFYDDHEIIKRMISTSEKKARLDEISIGRPTANKPVSLQLLVDAINQPIEKYSASHERARQYKYEVHSPPKFDEDKLEQMMQEDIRAEIHRQDVSSSQMELNTLRNVSNRSDGLQNRSKSRSSQQLQSKQGSNDGLKESKQNKENLQISHFNSSHKSQKRYSGSKRRQQ